jgi:hypothetical protein
MSAWDLTQSGAICRLSPIYQEKLDNLIDACMCKKDV